MSERRRILIVDDDASIRKQLSWGLSDDYDLRTAAGFDEALELARDFRPDLVTLDVSLTARAGESEEGLEILARLRDVAPDTKVIVVTASDRAAHGARAVDLGAFDYYEKPIDLAELRVVVRRALHMRRLEERAADAVGEEVGEGESLLGFACSGREMREACSQAARAATTDVGVVFVGEPGSGRVALARAVHRLSGRGGPLRVLDCGAIPGDRLERKLFGSPDGASEESGGLLESCRGGTLVLADVGSMPEPVQAGLARRLGGARDDVSHGPRFVSTSVTNLREAADSGSFRYDLCYALGIVTIHVPPLRERRGDIVAIARGFLRACADEYSRTAKRFTKSAERAMLSHSWPGNVAELENRVRRAVVMSRARSVSAADLGLEEGGKDHPATLQEARGELERDMVVDALVRSAGNVSRAARAIGVSRPTMYDLIRKHEIDLTGLKGATGH